MAGADPIRRGKSSRATALILVALLSVCSVAAAGPLGDFEAEATKKKEEEWKHETVKTPRPATYRKSDAQPESRCNDLFLCLFSDMLGGIFNAIVKGGSEVSLARALDRDPGDHDLPLVGADVNFQTISPQINAIDGQPAVFVGKPVTPRTFLPVKNSRQNRRVMSHDFQTLSQFQGIGLRTVEMIRKKNMNRQEDIQ